MVDAWDEADDARRIGSRARTVGEHFATEQPLLAPLPTEPFETGRWFTPRVDRHAQVTVRMNKYSVHARMVGRQARVLLNASGLVVFDGRTEIARHERLMTKGSTRVDLDHYLEVLLRKPGALPGAKALEQARASGRFTPVHDAWWAAACKAHGDADGTRALIEVLMLHRHLPHDHVVAGLATALRAGALTADAVALEARKYNDTADGGADDTTADHQSLMSGDRARGEGEIPAVRSLTERRLRAHIPADTGRCRAWRSTTSCWPADVTPRTKEPTPRSTKRAGCCECPPFATPSPTRQGVSRCLTAGSSPNYCLPSATIAPDAGPNAGSRPPSSPARSPCGHNGSPGAQGTRRRRHVMTDTSTP
jgi:hypothetical protein